MRQVGLDHVGVVTADLAALAAQYVRLGFQLTPLARQADGRIGNRCVMLRQGYIELLAVVDGHARSATLERFLARYAGIHILAFSFADAQEELARLRRAGVAAPSVQQTARTTNSADPAAPVAQFELIQLPDQPEGRINLVRHVTPEALWQEPFLLHRNNAVVLAEVVLDVADAAESAARLSRLCGCAAVPDRRDGLALDLAGGRVLIRQATGAGLPRISRLMIGTSDANAMALRCVSEAGVAHYTDGAILRIAADAAGGVDLCFVAAA